MKELFKDLFAELLFFTIASFTILICSYLIIIIIKSLEDVLNIYLLILVFFVLFILTCIISFLVIERLLKI